MSAPAKVNVGLRVGPIRDDGYHPVYGLFQAVSLADEIEVTRHSADGEIVVEGDFDRDPAETTIAKAVALYRVAAGLGAAVSVRTEKRVPAGAGLGGASSDAAAALRAMDALFDRALDPRALLGIGARIGSDVPFFLSRTGLALVGGRGESVRPLPPRATLSLVVAWPGFPSYTPVAFADLDRARSGERVPPCPGPSLSRGLIERMKYGRDSSSWDFRNDFERVIDREEGSVSSMLGAFADSGALYVSLSGSGSAWYATYRDEAAAREGAAKVRARWARLGGTAADEGKVFACSTLACMPPLRYNS